MQRSESALVRAGLMVTAPLVECKLALAALKAIYTEKDWTIDREAFVLRDDGVDAVELSLASPDATVVARPSKEFLDTVMVRNDSIDISENLV